MSIFRRKPKPPPPAFDTRELRQAANRLTGWKWTGEGPLDPRGLLDDAATEIDRLHTALADRDAANPNERTPL